MSERGSLDLATQPKTSTPTQNTENSKRHQSNTETAQFQLQEKN